MKLPLITILIICSSFHTIAVQGQAKEPSVEPNKVVLIGEVRYHNDTPVFWNKNTTCEFYLKLSQGIKVKVDTKVFEKEDFYNKGTAGTEIVFYIDKNMYSSTLQVEGTFYTKDDSNNRVIKCKRHSYELIIEPRVWLNNMAYKLQNTIQITDPELFSLTSMNNYLDERLSASSIKQGGYSGTVDKLERMLRDHDRRIPDFETMESFYALYAFIKPYAADNSFYNSEADKLKNRIDVLQARFTDTIKGGGKTTLLQLPPAEQNDLLEELVTSQQVYDRYRKMYEVLHAYYLSIPLLLQRKDN